MKLNNCKFKFPLVVARIVGTDQLIISEAGSMDCQVFSFLAGFGPVFKTDLVCKWAPVDFLDTPKAWYSKF